MKHPQEMQVFTDFPTKFGSDFPQPDLQLCLFWPQVISAAEAYRDVGFSEKRVIHTHTQSFPHSLNTSQ